MSWDDFKKQMEEAHRRAQAEFANTERIVTQDEVKFWEFDSVLVRRVHRHESYSWPTVLPVKNSDGETIGAASIVLNGKGLNAKVTVDYHIPERLDFETDQNSLVLSAQYIEHESVGEPDENDLSDVWYDIHIKSLSLTGRNDIPTGNDIWAYLNEAPRLTED